MDLVPWKPSGELASLRKEMDKVWSRFFGETSFPGFISQEWMPSVDISETKDTLLVKAEIPGMDVKDVSVTVSGDILTIKGEKKREEEKKDEHYYCSERYCGSFQRSIRLPVNIIAEKVEATFEKGVLQVTLPKTEEAKKKEIKIKVK